MDQLQPELVRWFHVHGGAGLCGEIGLSSCVNLGCNLVRVMPSYIYHQLQR